MEKQIISIDYNAFGLESNEAETIQAVFVPMLEKMKELEIEYNQILELDLSEDTSKKAGELRRRYVKIRTWTAEIHKKAKAYYLAWWRFVDGWKNAQAFASQWKEEMLEKIEKFWENKEKERIEKINTERKELLAPYEVENLENMKLWEMEQGLFDNFFAWCRMNYEARKEAERKAEEDRIKKEQEEREEQEKIRKENEKLRAEAEAREKEMGIERERIRKEQEALRLENERKQKEIEDKARAEAEEARRKQKEIEDKLAEEERKRKELEEQKRIAEEMDRKEEEERIIAEENKKKAEEEFRKQAEFVEFLKSNWCTEDNKKDFIIQDEDWKLVLYKKIAEYSD